jgi:tetratricopeptide (TPR) repeat protein
VRAAEGLLEAHRYEDALAAFRASRQDASTAGSPALGLRIVTGEAWALVRTGELEEAMFVLEAAASASVSGGLTDVDRAEVVFLVGVVRYHESRIAEAITLLDQALVLAEGSAERTDRLRSDILHWRARCHRRIVTGWPRRRTSTVRWSSPERSGTRAGRGRAVPGLARRSAPGSLGARPQVRRTLAPTSSRRSATGRRWRGLLNNLAGLNHLLGTPDRSIELLEEAFEIFVDLDLPGSMRATSARRSPRSGSTFGQAELARHRRARRSTSSTARTDHLQEVGHGRARARPLARDAGSARGGGGVDRARRGDLRARELGEPSQLRLARSRRPREPAR